MAAFEPQNVQKHLGKWHASVVAADLGMWKHDGVQSGCELLQRCGGETLTEDPLLALIDAATALHGQMPTVFRKHCEIRLRREAATDVAKSVGWWFSNARLISQHGYGDIGRRLYGLAISLLPEEADPQKERRFEALQDHFMGGVANGDWAVAAASAFVSKHIGTAPGSMAVGAPTAYPMLWPNAGDAGDVRWTALEVLPEYPEITAYVALVSGEDDQWWLATVHCLDGVSSHRLPLRNPQWILAMEGVEGTYAVAESSGGVSEVYVNEDVCEVTSQLATGVTSVLPPTMRLAKVPGCVAWEQYGIVRAVRVVDGQVEECERDEANEVYNTVVEHNRPAARGRYVYHGGACLFTLPRGETVTAVHGDRKLVDVFTEAGDWWRVDVEHKVATVVGLALGGRVVDVVPVNQ